jgi:sirohydrochlorin ferrochelatase
MTSDALLLIGRAGGNARTVIETHADRLERRGVADEVHTVTYEHEPVRELRRQLKSIDADRVYALATWIAHTADTVRDVPAALAAVPGAVHSCEPLGRNPAVTDVLLDRASSSMPASEDVTLVLVGLGSGSVPHQRRTAEYHAARIEERSAYGEARTCYLYQNPTVECARYAASSDRMVAVPLFLARSDVTEERIPAKLELNRGGVAYADPLGDHPRVTAAIQGEVQRQRVLVHGDGASSLDAGTTTRHPIVSDGEGESVRR